MISAMLLPFEELPGPLPSPIPTPIDVGVDPNRVTPGIWGFVSLVFLGLAVVLIYFSMRKQLGRVNFEEDAPLPAGVRPLPPYATKDARRASALAAKERAQAVSEQRRAAKGMNPTAETPQNPEVPDAAESQ